jgi:uncharacterized protein (TIGR03435 family)
VRHETQQVPGYVLILVGDGLKIKETSESPESPLQLFNEKGEMVIRGKSTLAQLASILNVGAPVMNKTGLTGIYDYEFVPPPRTEGAPRGAGQTQPGPPAVDANAWSAALEAQLGLRLAREPAVPTSAIVIEHAELPSPN